MATTLKKLKPLHPPIVVPLGAVPFGVTEDGRQLYKEVTPRSGSEADKGEDGKQRWRKNQMTGEPLYPLRKPTFHEHTRIYYLESQGNGNIGKVDYQPPSPEELVRIERGRKVEAMKDHLAEALVDADVTPGELAGLFTRRVAERERKAQEAPADLVVPELPDLEPEEPVAAEVVDLEPEATVTYPIERGGGWYELSDGTKLQGDEDHAVDAEIALGERRQQVKREAELIPEI